MRWGALFDDLESQLVAAELAAVEYQAGDLFRAEQALLKLGDRLRAHSGEAEFLLRCGLRVRGCLTEAAEDWFALEAPPRSVLVPMFSVVSVSGLSREARPETSPVRRRLGFGSALRALARDRAEVGCHLEAGGAAPLLVSGLIDTVGGDYLEVATVSHDGAPGRSRRTVVVPFGAIIAISSIG
jgi:hypothetical protein